MVMLNGMKYEFNLVLHFMRIRFRIVVIYVFVTMM